MSFKIMLASIIAGVLDLVFWFRAVLENEAARAEMRETGGSIPLPHSEEGMFSYIGVLLVLVVIVLVSARIAFRHMDDPLIPREPTDYVLTRKA